jgi:hypothetical protein
MSAPGRSATYGMRVTACALPRERTFAEVRASFGYRPEADVSLSDWRWKDSWSAERTPTELFVSTPREPSNSTSIGTMLCLNQRGYC